jgi:tetratricopeptide (TPR) repeat protein
MKYLLPLILLICCSACHSKIQQTNRQGLEQMKQNQYEQAVLSFNSIIQEKADWLPAYYNRAISYAHLQKYDKAIQDLSYFIANFPNHTDAYFNRAIIYENMGNYANAIRDYSETIKLCPEFISAYHYRGITRFRMNDMEGALKDYNQALDLGKNVKMDVATAKKVGLNSSALYFNRGVILQKKGEYEAAIQDYTQAIEIDPSQAKTYYNRAMAKMALSKLPEARKDLEIAFRLGSKQAQKAIQIYFSINH